MESKPTSHFEKKPILPEIIVNSAYTKNDKTISNLYGGKRQGKMGKVTIALGGIFILTALFCMSNFFYDNIFGYSFLQNLFLSFFFFLIGIALVIFGRFRYKKAFFEKDPLLLLGNPTKKTIMVFKIIAVCLFVLVIIWYIFDSISSKDLFKSLLTETLPPYRELAFYGLLSRFSSIIGIALCIIYFAFFFGKKNSTLFSTGLLWLAGSEISSWIAVAIEFFYYRLEKNSSYNFFADQFTNISAGTIVSYISSFLLCITLILISYNIKNDFPKQVNIVILILLSCVCGVAFYFFISSIINSIVNHYFGVNIYSFCRGIFIVVLIFFYSKYRNLYFIKLHYADEAFEKTLNAPEGSNLLKRKIPLKELFSVKLETLDYFLVFGFSFAAYLILSIIITYISSSAFSFILFLPIFFISLRFILYAKEKAYRQRIVEGEIDLTLVKSDTKNIDIDDAKLAPIRFCRKCGAKLQHDALFCYKCGTKIKIGEENDKV